MDTALAKAGVYTDFSSLTSLRADAVHKNDSATLHKVASQFEAIFINMMLKNMRQTGVGDSLFGSSQESTYRDMADQQLALDMSASGGIGLAEVMIRQLSARLSPGSDADAPASGEQGLVMRRYPGVSSSNTKVAAGSSVIADARVEQQPAEQDPGFFGTPQAFVKGVWKYASDAAQALGTTPEVVVAQAALETGWGKHIFSHPDGKSSNNLFGIKADQRWPGDKAYVPTTEFRHGRMVREYAAFRAYDSLEQGFRDYVDFISSGQRYQQALDTSADPEQYIHALHQAGYATDPQYPDKVKRIMNSSEFRKMVSEVEGPL